MRRSRKFLTFILFLLVINTLFFLAWYVFDGQGWVKGIVEREAGKALKGEFGIGSFTISDQQVFAENISFAAADSSLNFTADNARIRFNLLRFIFSGFKMRNLMNRIEIDGADIQLSILPKLKEPKKKFEIPDLIPIFNNLTLSNSRFRLDLRLPLKIGEEGLLAATDEFRDVNLSIINTDRSTLSLAASPVGGGSLRVNGVLDKGRLVSSRADLLDYNPQYLSHPQFRDFAGELDLVASASQTSRDATPEIKAHLTLTDASALALEKYPLSIPRLELDTDGEQLSAILAWSGVGTSSVGGKIMAHNILDGPVLEPSQLDLQLDLAMLGPSFNGIVDGTLTVEGTLADPLLRVTAGSDRVTISGQSVQNISLTAAYEDDLMDLDIREAVWQNQKVDLAGIFETKERKFTGTLDTVPVNLAKADLKVAASADLELYFYESVPEVRAQVHELSYAQNDYDFQGLAGTVNLVPFITPTAQNYLLDASISSPLGIDLNIIGDLSDSYFLVDAELNSLQLATAYPQTTINQYEPELSGDLSAYLTGTQLVFSSALSLDFNKGLNLVTDLDLIGSYDLKSQDGDLVLNVPNGKLNGQTLTLDLVAQTRDQTLKFSSLNLNDQLLASGNLNLKDFQDMGFQISLMDVGSELINTLFPNLNLPDISGMDLKARYSSQGEAFVDAELGIREVKIPGFKPLSVELSLLGDPQLVNIQGTIKNQTRLLVDLAGDAMLDEGWNLRLNALASNLELADLLASPLAAGEVSGNVGLFVSDVLTRERELTFDARLSSPRLSVPELADFEDVLISLAQTRNLLIVDTLTVRTPGYGSVRGSGALDYNLLSNTMFEGGHTLELQAEGLLFEWLDREYEYVREASGETSLVCSIKTQEDQLMVQSGNLRIRQGRFVLADQPEEINNIELDADIVENRVLINSLTAQMGNGILHAKNHFEGDPDLSLQAAMLDLGTLLVKIDEPGALLYVPDITLPRSRSRLVVRGQNAEYASITGPFEDMQVSAEVLINEASVTYPPNTDNLLNVIYSFRGSLIKETESSGDAIPLPFNLDLMAIAQDNVKYSTYPASFVLDPGSYMHILFDGRIWLPQQSNITSEQGSLDFFGTKFIPEQLSFTITPPQKLVILKGSLTHETADGTIVTLLVDTDQESPYTSILRRVNFTLDSDNPDDVSTASIIGRMRFNASSERLSATQQGNLLQDEALSLISQNLNTSILSPILYPLENNIRRWLKLDDFSIRAGFIQNLFTEYTTDPNQLADYADMDQFMGNISQFSSSILLNNLSIYMSKYLGRRFFLDYTLTLQEATDLQNRSELMVSHDTSLRWYMPLQLRLAYTFKYEPWDQQLSHELMLQRSFKFWGL